MTDIIPDPAAIELTVAMQHEDPEGQRTARVFRETFDQAYDGMHTGRFRPEELSKTELAHIGSLLEINLRREFDGFIQDGNVMDYSIIGCEVDCKYSKQPFGWMIPNETVGHVAMVCHANDRASTWRLGFVKVEPDLLTSRGNRDQKRQISASSRSAISWVWFDQPMPPNILLQMKPQVADKIMNLKSGQKRIDALFKLNLGVRIPRGTVATVALQKDYMKRLRYNGGARTSLKPEGIILLGDYRYHRHLAKQLALPVPSKGDTVAVRLTQVEPTDIRAKVRIDNRCWAIARDSDPVTEAPSVPFTSSNSKIEDSIQDAFPDM